MAIDMEPGQGSTCHNDPTQISEGSEGGPEPTRGNQCGDDLEIGLLEVDTCENPAADDPITKAVDDIVPNPAVTAPPSKGDLLSKIAEIEGQEAWKLKRMGILSALAIGIHNFPEGIASFVSSLHSQQNGFALGLAIAIHNIPEGMVIAVPIYFATKSRLRGFLWSAVAGLAEPVGGLFAYVVFQGRDLDALGYGIFYSFVAGIMTFISVADLLPAALRYDPEGRVTPKCFFLGMAVIAVSLMLFEL